MHVANLLPGTERAHVRGERYMRLGVYALLGVLVSILMGGILSLPSFFVAKSRERTLTAQRDALVQLIELKQSSTTGVAINEIKARLALLESARTADSPHNLFVDIITRAPAGVVIWNYTFMRESEDVVVATLSGRADSREALLSFGDALRQSGTFGSVDIPVASLARSENIPFSLSFTVLSNNTTEYTDL